MILLNLFNVCIKVAYDNFNNKRRYDDNDEELGRVVDSSALYVQLLTGWPCLYRAIHRAYNPILLYVGHGSAMVQFELRRSIYGAYDCLSSLSSWSRNRFTLLPMQTFISKIKQLSSNMITWISGKVHLWASRLHKSAFVTGVAPRSLLQEITTFRQKPIYLVLKRLFVCAICYIQWRT